MAYWIRCHRHPATENDGFNEIENAVRELLSRVLSTGESSPCPLGPLIQPGETVLIKPNLVIHRHYLGKQALYGSVVHGAVLGPIVKMVLQAMAGRGRVTIADNPVEGADFEALMEFTGIRRVAASSEAAHGGRVHVFDLRPRVLEEDFRGRFQHRQQEGDPLGYVEVDLGSDSLFAELDHLLGVHYYTLADATVDHLDPRRVQESQTDCYHRPGVHKYLVSRSILDADVIINVAKMKTHCKAGVSLCLKNMIGMVYLKECMPHHRPGKPPLGDSFPEFPATHYVASRKAYRFLRRAIGIHRLPGFRALRNALQKKGILVGAHIEHGNWKGNDTLWRTILDLNRIALYADRNGVMRDEPQRRMLCIVDGVIGQEGEGPMAGTPVHSGILFAGLNPVLVDALAVKSMGIDWRTIPQIARASSIQRWPLLEGGVNLDFLGIETPNLHFKLPRGWR